MSLRTRLVLAFVLLTSLATAAVGAWSYLATVDRLYAEIDRSLDDIAAIAIELGTAIVGQGDGPRWIGRGRGDRVGARDPRDG
jgi:hypothetical protein